MLQWAALRCISISNLAKKTRMERYSKEGETEMEVEIEKNKEGQGKTSE
jgi:hypothetical protein